MSDAPERIWLAACGDDDAGSVWECVSAHVADPSLDVEYVRADLVAALVEAVKEAIQRIDELNTLPPDENGHCWRESDLMDQEVMAIRAALAAMKGGA